MNIYTPNKEASDGMALHLSGPLIGQAYVKLEDAQKLQKELNWHKELIKTARDSDNVYDVLYRNYDEET